MEINIRPATIEDFEKIQELNSLLFKNDQKFDSTLDLSWPNSKEGIEYFKNSITSENSCVFVSIVDGKIIGYLIGSISDVKSYRKKIKLGELDNMFVMETHRNLGIGSKLVENFIEWCKTNKVERIRTIASSGNKDAIKFYEQHGLKKYSIILEADL